MRKLDELSDPNSCMSRARDDEWTFVLLGRDRAAPRQAIALAEDLERQLAAAQALFIALRAALTAHNERVRRETAWGTLLEVLSHEERTGPRDHDEMVVSSEAIRAMGAALEDIDWSAKGDTPTLPSPDALAIVEEEQDSWRNAGHPNRDVVVAALEIVRGRLKGGGNG